MPRTGVEVATCVMRGLREGAGIVMRAAFAPAVLKGLDVAARDDLQRDPHVDGAAPQMQ